jgi:hypothetical protein
MRISLVRRDQDRAVDLTRSAARYLSLKRSINTPERAAVRFALGEIRKSEVESKGRDLWSFDIGIGKWGLAGSVNGNLASRLFRGMCARVVDLRISVQAKVIRLMTLF